MRLLVDTHIALWAIVDDERLPAAARALIVDPENEIHVSAASIWEIAIKQSLARGRANDMPVSATAALGYFRQSGYLMLPVTPDHAAAVATLPKLHADPFDRMLLAQALMEPLRLVTHDDTLGRYSDTVLVI